MGLSTDRKIGVGTREARLERYVEVRRRSLALTEELSAEDQLAQSMPDASPAKWHLAHTTWFFETFLLSPHLPGYQPFDPMYGYLFNSYYETLGARSPGPSAACSPARRWRRC